MSPFKIFCLATRPVACLTAFAGTWVVALLTTALNPWSIEALIPAAVMGLSCLAASLFYAGAAPKKVRYQPKFIDRPLPEYRYALLPIAGVVFLLALILSARFLPWFGLFYFFVFSTAVVMYVLHSGGTRYWLGRSMHAAFICMSCVPMGSLYTTPGQDREAVLLMSFAFLAYFLRGVLKHLDEASRNSDLEDLPLRLNEEKPPVYVGIGGGMRIAGIIALFTTLFFVFNMPSSPDPLLRLVYGFLLFGLVMFCLWLLSGLRTFFIRGTHHAVTALVWVLMVVLVAYRPT